MGVTVRYCKEKIGGRKRGKNPRALVAAAKTNTLVYMDKIVSRNFDDKSVHLIDHLCGNPLLQMA